MSEPYRMTEAAGRVDNVRFAARFSGLASGLALAVRPAGLAEAPALKGGS